MLSQCTTATSAFEDTEMDIVNSLAHGREECTAKKLGETVNTKLNYGTSYLPLNFIDVNKVPYCALRKMECFHIT